MRHRVLFSARRVLAMAAVLLLGVPPLITAQSMLPPEVQEMMQAQGHQVVAFSDPDVLLGSHFLTMIGRSTLDGGCEFAYPLLSLAPGEHAIQARQVATDFTACTTLIEIGVPLADSGDPVAEAEGDSETLEAVPPGKARAPRFNGGVITQATGSSSGYYRVWWEDVINLRVTEAKSNISWAYDGSCVTAASGSLSTWWLTTTGWSKYSSGSWVTTGCSSRKVYSDATFKNGAFCWPGTVWNYYDNVTVRGSATNVLSGWVDSTWTTYPFACPTLHYHTELKRVTG